VGVLTASIWLKILTVSPYCTEVHRQPYLNLHSEYPTVWNSGACYCSPVILITGITVLFICGEALTYSQDRPSVLSYQFSDAIDRKSSGKYPHSKPHANCICAACLATPCSAVRLAMYQSFRHYTNYVRLTEHAGSV
jgi:hypothetical protein